MPSENFFKTPAKEKKGNFFTEPSKKKDENFFKGLTTPEGERAGGIPSIRPEKLGIPEGAPTLFAPAERASTETPGDVAARLAKGEVLREVPPSLRDRFNAAKRTGHTVLTDIFIRSESATVGYAEELISKTMETIQAVSAPESPGGQMVAPQEIPTVARNAAEGALRASTRVVREIFHGLPGVEGERKLFPELLRDLGLPEGPKASTIAPMLFHDRHFPALKRKKVRGVTSYRTSSHDQGVEGFGSHWEPEWIICIYTVQTFTHSHNPLVQIYILRGRYFSVRSHPGRMER